MENKILITMISLSGLTQKMFAEKVNISESQLSKWLSYERNIKMSKVVEIAKNIGYNVEFKLEKWKQKEF